MEPEEDRGTRSTSSRPSWSPRAYAIARRACMTTLEPSRVLFKTERSKRACTMPAERKSECGDRSTARAVRAPKMPG